MKKTLVAIAALTAVSAFAQSSVTIYGLIDTGWGQRTNTGPLTNNIGIKTTAVQFGGFNSNRLGFRGTEDLGGGLKANFLVETGLTFGENAPDSSTTLTTKNGGTSFGDRGAFLEVEGGFGKVTVGRQNTGARDVYLGFDVSGAINIAGNLNSPTGNDSGNANSYALGSSINAGSHSSYSNAIKYTAPTFSGVTLAAAVTSNNIEYTNNAATQKTAQGYSAGGVYMNGPISAAVSYSSAKSGVSSNAGTTTTLDVADVTTNTTAIGASYNLGVAKLSVTHFKLDQVNATNTIATSGLNVQRKSTTFGVQVPVTKQLSGFASMGNGNLQFGNGYNKDLSATQFGANYALSKRTVAKLAYGTTKTTESATTESKVKEIGVAIVHQF